MKKTIQFIKISLLLITSIGFAQNFTCGGVFTDAGGVTANYANNSNYVVTILPTNPSEKVTVHFASFDTEANWDGLYVYNGSSTSAPQYSSNNGGANIPGGLPGAFWGTQLQGVSITSTAQDGALTFRFVSDNIVNKPGWIADISCSPPSTCPIPSNIVKSNITTNSVELSWTENGTATQWEIYVTPAGTAPPTMSSTGILTSSNPFVLTNLNAATSYNVYVRSICSSTEVSNWSYLSNFTTLTCATIPQPSYSANSQSFTWNSNNSTQWEVIIQLASLPSPTANSIGQIITTNSFTPTGLICGTTYKFFVRSFCTQNNTPTNWSSGTTYTTPICVLTDGQPNNLFECNSNGSHCFDLIINNAPILGTSNPSEFIITYHLSNTNAVNETNAITVPQCVTNQTITIYALVKKIATNEKMIKTFTIAANSINPIQIISNIVQCDDNADGTVIFDLTSNIVSQNIISFYLSQLDAQNQVNAIANPLAYVLNAGAPAVTIFARETIPQDCDNLYRFQLQSYQDCSLSYICSQANSLCGTIGVPFHNTHQAITAEPGNYYGCLGSQPNPTWFYLPIDTAGNLNITISQNSSIDFTGTSLDVDFILYGPFADPAAACNGGLTQANTVNCSFSGSATENFTLLNALPGQFYVLMTTNFSNQAGYIKINLNATSTGSIECSGMRLQAFLDSNANGVKDAEEQNFPLGQFHYEVNNDGAIHNITSPAGVYNIYDTNQNNSYDLTYTIDNAYVAMFSTTASYQNVNIVTGAGLTTYNFPISILQNYLDVATYIVPINQPRAGFNYKNKIVYANLGNQTIPSGTITFVKDPNLTIGTISQAGTTPTTTGFTYNYSSLLPFEVRHIDVTMAVPSIPNVTIAQLLTNTVNIDPTTSDIQVLNNQNALSQPVIAAYDPNDKTEAHGEKILFDSFATNDYLTYTIRFENEGNASAINIRVKDILDNKIDETSLVMLDASHSYILDRVENELVWNFNNIQLPVSIPNTTTGKGYITFKVKLKAGFELGDIIPNTAEIYFDTNPAIITNTFQTEFVNTLGTSNFENDDFTVYPNPATSKIQITLNTLNGSMNKITIYDIIGKTVKAQSGEHLKQANISVSDLTPGVYIIEINTTDNNKITKKLIIN